VNLQQFTALSTSYRCWLVSMATIAMVTTAGDLSPMTSTVFAAAVRRTLRSWSAVSSLCYINKWHQSHNA